VWGSWGEGFYRVTGVFLNIYRGNVEDVGEKQGRCGRERKEKREKKK